MMLLRLSILTGVSFYLLAVCVASEKASKPLLRRALKKKIRGTPILKEVLPEEGHNESGFEEWVIESFEEDEPSGTSLVYDIDGLPQGFFKNEGIVSGKDTITMSVATKSRGNGNAPYTITINPGSRVTINRGDGGRRLAPKTGTSSVLVVNVYTPDPAEDPQRDAEQLSSDCFGIGAPDNDQMVSRYDACSGGRLNLEPATNTANITNGVVEVTIPFNATGVKSDKTVENAAREAAAAKVGSLSQWTHVMLTWTKYAIWPGAAYAYVNSRVSCYKDVHIWKMGIQVHGAFLLCVRRLSFVRWYCVLTHSLTLKSLFRARAQHWLAPLRGRLLHLQRPHMLDGQPKVSSVSSGNC